MSAGQTAHSPPQRRRRSRDLFGYVLPAGYVVQEEEGTCAGADDVVDAHRNAVYPDGVVPAHQKCDLQLCSDPVCPADKHGILHPGKIRRKQPAEASYARQNAGSVCPLYVAFHKLNGAVAGGDVNPRASVTLALAFHFYFLSVSPLPPRCVSRSGSCLFRSVSRSGIPR